MVKIKVKLQMKRMYDQQVGVGLVSDWIFLEV